MCVASGCSTDGAHVEPPTAWGTQQQHDAAVTIQPCGGSGSLIGDGMILTARHVACTDSVATTAAGVVLPTTLAWRDGDHDLALLAVTIDSGAAFAQAAVLDSAAVMDTVCGEVALPSRQRRCGTVTDVRDVGTSSGHVDLWISINAVPGNSGSALYDDHGHLVGVITDSVYGVGLASSVYGRLPSH